MSGFNSDITRRLMASNLWLWGPPGRCNQCEAALPESSLRFRWCEHLFCMTCALGVLGACPQCQAEPPEVSDDDLAAEAEAVRPTAEKEGDLRPLGAIVAVVLFLLLVLALAR